MSERGIVGEKEKREKRMSGVGRRWCSWKAIGGGDGSVEQKGCGEYGWGRTPMQGERRCRGRGVSN